jgi:hypothetical protein
MNDYGPMSDAMRRVAEYQQCEIHHMPGYDEHAYMVGIHENGTRVYDTFVLTSDNHINAALNTLYLRASSPK